MRSIRQENLKKNKEAKAVITYGKRACNTIVHLCKKHKMYPVLQEHIEGKSLEEMNINMIQHFRTDLMVGIEDRVLDYFESIISFDSLAFNLRLIRGLYDLEQALEEIKECKNNA